MKKVTSKFLAFIAFIMLALMNVNAQTGATLLDTNFEDWKTVISTDQANGSYDVPGATLKIQGGPKFNNSSTPNSGTSTEYPNYFRFGSAGSETNQYLEITPDEEFVTGGRITIIVSTNSNAADVNVFTIADSQSWDVPLAEFNQIGKVFTTKTFDLPETYSGTKTIRLYRTATTTFLHAIKIETNGGSPSIASFKIGELEATIDQEAGTITAELPQGSALAAITPDITLGGSAKSYTPTGAQDFTNPITYTAFNADNSASKVYTVTLTVAVTLSDDATLKSLKYKEASVANFASDTYEYTIELPYGSAVPAVTDVTAETTHVNATVATPVRTLDALPTDISVTVTAENELATQAYIIHFTEKAAGTDVKLKTLKVNGVDKFVAGQTAYIVDLPYTTTEVPTVEATANDSKASLVITQATNLTGQATIVVTAEDGATKGNYTVSFNVLPAPTVPTVTWNFSEAPFVSETITTVKVVDGLTVYAAGEGGSGSDIVLEPNNKSIDIYAFTERLKLGGGGFDAETGVEYSPTRRYLSFNVLGNSEITVYGMSSSSGENRPLIISDNTQILNEQVLLGASITKITYSYTGAATTLYLYSRTGGLNLYAVLATNVGTGSVAITNVTSGDKEVKSVTYYDILGRPATADTKGLVIVKTTYTDGTSASGKVYRLDK